MDQEKDPIEQPEAAPNEEVPHEPETMTKDEFEKRLQAETDRRVNDALEKRLAKERQKFEKELQEKTQEAEKLAKMSEADRAKAKIDKERQALEAERRDFERQKLVIETERTMMAEDLPAEFSAYVIGDDAETTHANIKAFKEQWETALEAAASRKLDEKIQSNVRTPHASNKANSTMTKDEFYRLPYGTRTKMLLEDRDILSKLK